WSGVQAINAEARASYDRAASVVGQERFPALIHPTGRVETRSFVALRRAGWPVAPVLDGALRRGGQKLKVIGIDVLSMRLPGVDGDGSVNPAEILPGDDLAFAAPETVAALAGVSDLPALRVSDGIPPGRLLMDIAVAERLLDLDGVLTRLLVLSAPPDDASLEALAPGLIWQAPDQPSDIAQLTDSFHLNLTAFGFLAFTVGLFIVHGTVGLAFEQRRPVIRTLRALGVPLGRLIVLFAVEILVLAGIAGGLGIVLGYVLAGLLLPDVAATLAGLYGAEMEGTLSFRRSWAVAGLGMASTGAGIAAADALWKVARMPLLVSARPQAWAMRAKRVARWQGIAGLALLGFALGLAMFAEGLASGFAALAALLLGAALLLPTVLSFVVKCLIGLRPGPVWHWFWADTRQQVPGLSLALMALLFALAANIGVGTMVSSFRLTFVGWLDQRFASELYVRARSDAEGARLQGWLEDRADAVLPIWSARTTIPQPLEIFGIVDHPTYRENWPLLHAAPHAWDRLAMGDTALINEQTARARGVAPGQKFMLSPGWQVEIVGVYSDYGNPGGQAIVALPDLLARPLAVETRRFGVRIAPDRVASLRAALLGEFGLTEGNVVDQASLKAFSLRIFDRTFAVTAALNVLTLSVAGLAILTSLLTLSAMRLPQLVPVWALGLTRRRLAQMEVMRAVALTAFTFAVAVPVGLMLAWILLTVINVAAFGWRLPMSVFPLDWLGLLALASIAAVLAALGPARRLARTSPTQFLKVFSDAG
ncbi:MAG: ABC transporter permease, partial [Pseudomonadota bacterium]